MISLKNRASGILLHPTSLPGPYGIGDLGPEAHRFLGFLSRAGQSWWQMLPVNPPGAGDSPYSSDSAFAGSPLMISLERLVENGLLKRHEISRRPPSPKGRAVYRSAWAFKVPRLKKAFSRFKARRTLRAGFDDFKRKNAHWLPDYALFRALKDAAPRRPWNQWSPDLRRRKPRALSLARSRHRDAVLFNEFLQFIFFRQWADLKRRAADLRIGLIGDLPIFVSHESADVWVNPELFYLDARGLPTVVAGVPPDYFSKDGQLWGNPHYRWSKLRSQGYRWWIRRFSQALGRFDVLRLDHFIGFHRQWEVPAGALNARKGRWGKGPGAHFFEKLMASLGPLEIIAEDLGAVTPGVERLRDRFGFPGIKVLQFAFSGTSRSRRFLPENHPRRSVVYTGTHDNDTTAGWFADRGSPKTSRTPAQARREHARALRCLESDGREPHWDMIAAAMMSKADTAIIPMQDILGLGAKARMNTPGAALGNWDWRLDGRNLDPFSKRLRTLTVISDRLPG